VRRSPRERGSLTSSLAEGGAAALALGFADWTASGLARTPPTLVAATLIGAILLGLATAFLASLLGRPGLAAGLAMAVGLGLEGASVVSKEMVPGSARTTAAIVVLACVAACLALAWRRPDARARLVWSALAGAAVPMGSIVACVDFGTSSPWPRVVACATPLLVLGLERMRAASRILPFALLAGAAAVLLLPAVQERSPTSRHAASTRTTTVPPDARNVVLLVIDTLRADALDPRGNLAAFAREGLEFRSALAAAPWTLPSVGSLLTGLHPSEHGAVSALAPLPDGVVTLAESLRDAGYATAAFTGGAFVGPSHGLGQGFELFDWTAERRFPRFRLHDPLVWRLAKNRYFPLRWLVRAVDEYRGLAGSRDAAREWLASESARPVFVLLHTYQVHDYYLYDPDTDDAVLASAPLASAQFAGRLSVPPSELLHASPSDLAHFRALYDGRVAAVDAEFGELVRALEPLVGPDALWIVTADHGEGFDAEHHRVHHGGRLHDDLLHVPLIVRAPGLVAPGTSVAEPVRLVDVMPTLLDLLGIPAPAHLAGESLVPALHGVRPFPAVAFAEEREHGLDLLAVRRGRWKAIDAPGRTELYDVERDAGELRPEARDLPPELRADVDAFRREHPARTLERATLDPDTLEHLQDLGYVE